MHIGFSVAVVPVETTIRHFHELFKRGGPEQVVPSKMSRNQPNRKHTALNKSGEFQTRESGVPGKFDRTGLLH